MTNMIPLKKSLRNTFVTSEKLQTKKLMNGALVTLPHGLACSLYSASHGLIPFQLCSIVVWLLGRNRLEYLLRLSNGKHSKNTKCVCVSTQYPMGYAHSWCFAGVKWQQDSSLCYLYTWGLLHQLWGNPLIVPVKQPRKYGLKDHTNLQEIRQPSNVRRQRCGGSHQMITAICAKQSWNDSSHRCQGSHQMIAPICAKQSWNDSSHRCQGSHQMIAAICAKQSWNDSGHRCQGSHQMIAAIGAKAAIKW